MANNTRPIGYQMHRKTYNGILEARTDEDKKKKKPIEFVIDYINEQYCLRGKVTSLQIVDM